MNKCILIIGATALSVWTAAAADVPKVETFIGYSYVRANTVNQNAGLGQKIGGFDMNGGSGQFIYNFNKWISGVADIGAYYKPNVGIVNVEDTTATFLFGPRISYRNKSSRFTPYGQVLFGVAYRAISTRVGAVTDLTAPALPVVSPADLFPGPLQPITGRLTDSQNAFALAAGAGLDIRIKRHFSFRPVSADYVLTRFPDLSTGRRANQNSLRASAGFIFTFGGEKPAPKQPPPPATKTCPDGTVVSVNATCPKMNVSLGINAGATEVCQGDTTNVTASVPGGAANHLTYTWSVNGQPTAQGPSFQFGTAGRDPGTYKVKVSASGNTFNPASVETSITVLAYQPPTGTVEANPSQIHVGEKSTLTASFHGQCGGTIQAPTFTASEGTVNGDQFDSTGVVFDSSNNAEQRKTVTITAKAADNKSVGTATTNVEVVKGPVVAPIRLPDVLFPKNSARVNNCGKRILLEQLQAYYQRDSTGTVVLVGHQSSDETNTNLSQERALNAAAVITAGTGVCLSIPQSQVQVSAPGVDQNGVPFEPGFCQASVGRGASSAVDERRVVVWFVPIGGQLPASVTNSQAATSLPVSSLGCPK
jgi:outer membrane protein OmpA-like peptidoglycan-associated protein